MKNLRIAFFSLLTLTFTAGCYAESEGPFNIGVLIGESTLNIRGNYYDVPINGGREAHYQTKKAEAVSLVLTGSYDVLDFLAVEVQLASMLQPDTIFRGVDTPGGGESSMKVTSNAFGTYAVYKLGGDAYVKARLGLAVSNAKFETDAANQSYSDFGISYGISIGQKFGIGALEILYMRYPDLKVSKPEFASRFDSGAALNVNGEKSNVTISRDLSNEVFSVGYVFTF